MRLLIASDFYPPFIGGAERQTQLLSRNLAERGHPVHVATVWHEGLPEEATENGVTVHRLKGFSTSVPWFSKDPARRYHPPFPDPFLVIRLRRLIKQVQPEVVHASGWIAYSCAAALIGSRIPLLVSARDYGYFCAIRTLIREGQLCDGPALTKCVQCAAQSYGIGKAGIAVPAVFVGRALLRHKASGIHSISSFVASLMQKHFRRPAARAARVEVTIPSFLDPMDEKATETVELKALLQSLPGEPYILFVGALQAHKGLLTLLEAYQRLTSPPPLVLIGTCWPDTPRQLPPNVTMLTDVPHDHVMLAWERCLFGVAPSLWPEPLGGVVFEAMSKGKAMIGTTPGGHTDMIVDGETGYLIPGGDVTALARAMQQLIDDPAERDRFGKAAQTRATRFTAASAVPQFEAAYGQITRSFQQMDLAQMSENG